MPCIINGNSEDEPVTNVRSLEKARQARSRARTRFTDVRLVAIGEPSSDEPGSMPDGTG